MTNDSSVCVANRDVSSDIDNLKAQLRHQNNNNTITSMEVIRRTTSPLLIDTGKTDVINSPTNHLSDEEVENVPIKPVDPDGHAILDVECGDNIATLHLDRLLKGSRSPSVLFREKWLTPNEFQFVSGRKTAKDWKRSMRHHGRSLKMLIGKGVIVLASNSTQNTKCRCDVCTGIPHEALVSTN